MVPHFVGSVASYVFCPTTVEAMTLSESGCSFHFGDFSTTRITGTEIHWFGSANSWRGRCHG